LTSVGLCICLCASLASSAPGQKADAKPAKDPEQQARQEKAKKNPKTPGDASKKAEKKASPSAEERESAALAFVGEHHPELHGLLQQLKSDNPKQYQQAILDLYRASQRLSDRKEKDPVRYELELKAWKLDSQARLLAAKLAMDANPELEEQLKTALLQREDVRVGLLELDRTRTAGRLEQLDRELDKRRGRRDDDAQKAFEQIMRRSGKGRPKIKPAKETQAAVKKPKQAAPKQEAAAKQKAAKKQEAAKQAPVNVNP
jgi:hypothetical protein